MGELSIRVRPAHDDDRTGILDLAPRLAEGVAPWRDQAEALVAGRRWLEESLDAAKADGGVVLVVADEDGIAGVISARPSTHFTGERDDRTRTPGRGRRRAERQPTVKGASRE